MAQNALSVWKSIREEREVPEPPQDFSELRWAALLFGGSRCQVCALWSHARSRRADTSSRSVAALPMYSPSIFIYVADSARGAKNRISYVTESKFTTVFPGQDTALLDLIPYTDTGGRGLSSRFFLKADIEDIIRQWSALNVVSTTADATQNVLEEFRQERKEFVAGVLEDAEKYLEWLEWSYKERDADSRERRKVRAAAVRQKFIDMGYAAEDIQSIMAEKSVDSPNELTDRGWARIRVDLEKTLIEIRDRRIEQERQRRISRRLGMFKKAFISQTRTLHPQIWLQYPHWREVAAFPDFDEILSAPDNVTVNEGSLGPAMVQLPSLVTTWLEDRKAKLTRLAPARTPHVQPITTDVLTLATSVFKCGNLSCRNDSPAWATISTNPLFGWTDASHHICEDPQREYHGGYIQPATLKKTVVAFFQGASVVAAHLVHLVGLDPGHATVADMDRGAHHFFCSGCFPSQAVYTWRSAVAHVAQHRHAATPALQLLTSAEVQSVTKPRDTADAMHCWLCYHCSAHVPARQTKASVLDHITSQ
ncbi:hypothetical protein DXG01_010075 [Tephrocybe rancida]|nr:hypothetical protein DXG01_010075 [Tephrocybe rancida]